LIVGGKLLAQGKLNDHLLAAIAKKRWNAPHDECQEMEWGLHGDRDTEGLGAEIRV